VSPFGLLGLVQWEFILYHNVSFPPLTTSKLQAFPLASLASQVMAILLQLPRHELSGSHRSAGAPIHPFFSSSRRADLPASAILLETRISAASLRFHSDPSRAHLPASTALPESQSCP